MNFEMTNEKKVELCDILDNLNDNEKMSLLDEYSARDKMDVPSYIVMEEIDEYLADWTPSQIILSLATNFSCSDDGFWIDPNGDLHSGTISEYFAYNYCSIDIERWLERIDFDVDIDAISDWVEEQEEDDEDEDDD